MKRKQLLPEFKLGTSMITITLSAPVSPYIYTYLPTPLNG